MAEGAEYLVIKRTPCEVCGGDKVVASALYREFYDFQARWMAEHPDAEGVARMDAETAWWEAKGYGVGSDWPEEEQECLACDGTGDAVRYVGLAEAMEDAGIFAEIERRISAAVGPVLVAVGNVAGEARRAAYTAGVLANGESPD